MEKALRLKLKAAENECAESTFSGNYEIYIQSCLFSCLLTSTQRIQSVRTIPERYSPKIHTYREKTLSLILFVLFL